MGTRPPFAIEMAFLLLVLPVAFAYLCSLAGVAILCVRAVLRTLAFRLRPAYRREVARGR